MVFALQKCMSHPQIRSRKEAKRQMNAEMGINC